MHINVFANHKCGSVWFFRLLKAFSEINDLGFFSVNRGWRGFDKEELPKNACVLYRNAQYSSITNKCNAGLRIIRDPRALVYSAYFSHLKTHNVDDWIQLRHQRKLLQQFDKETGIRLTLAFLERANFYHNTVGPLNALSTWQFDDPRYLTMRMEDFVLDPVKHLRRTVVANGGDPDHYQYPNPEDFTFEAMSGRKPGIEDVNSHFRSGDPTDWVDNIPVDVQAYLEAHFRWIIAEHYTPHTV